MDDDDEPKEGSTPGISLVRGTYNQTYLIYKREECKEEEYQERRVLFRCGNWCYTGNVTLEKSDITLRDVPRAIPALQKQQNRLHFYCNATSVPLESPFYDPLKFVSDAVDFAASELASPRVHGELAKWADVYEWLETDVPHTYFEFQAEVPRFMSDLALAASKTYAKGLVFVTVYFEGVFYVVVQDGEGDQPLLDVKFPDVSRPGRGIHICNYVEAPWAKLTLWHAISGETPRKDDDQRQEDQETAPQKKILNLASDAYVQMYTILKAVPEPGSPTGTNPHHDVLFRFGSWCYCGSVQLTPELDLADLPHIIPALRMQQSRLDYLCDVSQVPVTSPFAKPMAYVAGVTPHLERELVAAEEVLRNLIDRLDRNNFGAGVSTWLEGDSSQSFFEFQLDLPPRLLDRHFKNVELVASKTYCPSGIVVVAVFFKATVYVVLSETQGEHPLLDSRFPDVSSKGRGYLIASYPEGLDGWPELRKVTIWQTKLALDLELAAHAQTAAADKDDDEDDPPEISRPAPNDDPAPEEAAQSKADASAKPAADFKESAAAAASKSVGGGDDDDDVAAKPNSADIFQAQPKKSHPLLNPIQGASGTKVNAPHRVPAVASLNEKLAKVRQQLSNSGAEAPWDEFGRPRSLSFKK
ncbi:hypothetical protein CTAYLR_008596 [Chrysophaeum taylorii]|uniref:Uncharacterized protein n=1 Tax=Chrysophaeum taylorii TaxID=2483200 RepID=A0AAD7UK23_9STRA|nr:hypothetical protein CTAYLR_008596 [Chrysophaeum taylorii]